jgi:hypothetical protein
MKATIRYQAARCSVWIAVFALLAASTLGLSVSANGETGAKTPGAGSTPAVAAQQSGKQPSEIDYTNETPSLANPQTTKKDNTERRPFQARVAVSPQGNGFQGALLPIPAGKRLVIENVSAIARRPEGLLMEINFFTYYDNNGDGVGDSADITFHRIALTDQGVFDGTAISSANHKVKVFADERIGTSHFFVVLQARLNGSTTGFTQAQVTFSGYVEDLPSVQ